MDNSRTLKPIVLAVHLALSGAALADPAPGELPTGGQVVSGQAVIQQQGTRMDIQQATQRAALDWRSFNIGAQAQVNFQQPGADAVALNRVTQGDASVIEGRLTANGQVFLVNPNGVLFAKGAQVDVGGIAATTMDIRKQDFENGNYRFTRGTASGAVINQGEIRANGGGYVALVAATVRNEGTIQANGGGTVALAAGDGARLEFGDGKLLNVQVDPATVKTLVENKQLIQAQDGRVLMTAAAASRLQGAVINNAGAVEASSLKAEGGVIRLTATGGDITNTGTLDASGKTGGGTVELAATPAADAQAADSGSSVTHAGVIRADATAGQGGDIQLAADTITLKTASQITARGHAGGGAIRAGGGKQGAALTLASGVTATNAKHVTVEAGAELDASATGSGDGGRVIAWADGDTRFAGTVKAEAGPDGGNGGFVETSGHQLSVDAAAQVSTAAPKGKTGEWLLDPYNVTVQTNPPADSGGSFDSNGVWTPSATSFIKPATIESMLGVNNVKITTVGSSPGSSTAGDIVVNDPIAWSSNTTLSLEASANLKVNANITASGATAGLSLLWGTRAKDAAEFPFSFTITNPHRIDLNGASPTLSLPTRTKTTGSQTTQDPLSVTAYTLIRDVTALQSMKNNLSGNYALANDIPDASGFAPIGDSTAAGHSFTGNFEGLGHAIYNLTINRPLEPYVGLFGAVGRPNAAANTTTADTLQRIANVGLINGNVIGGGGVNGLGGGVGGLAGFAGIQTRIDQTYFIGAVSGSGDNVGGLVGFGQNGNDGGNGIFNSYTMGTVFGHDQVGGLLGYQLKERVVQTFSHADVAGNDIVGGLVGRQEAALRSSFSTGSVTANKDITGATVDQFVYAGGLVGLIIGNASLYDSYSMGAVTAKFHGTPFATINGSSNAGGLVGAFGYQIEDPRGFNDQSGGNVYGSYSTGTVTASRVSAGTVRVGGLLGSANSTNTNGMYASFWDVDTSGIAAAPVPNGLIGVGFANGSIASETAFSQNSNQGLSHDIMLKGSTEPLNPLVLPPSDDPPPNFPRNKKYVVGLSTVGNTQNWGTTNSWATPGATLGSSEWGILEYPGDSAHYPYLTWAFPTGVQVVSGTLAGANGAMVNGAIIKAVSDGKALDQVPTYPNRTQTAYPNQPQATTGTNGVYYFALNLDTVPADQAMLVYQNAAPAPTGVVRLSGNDSYQNPAYSQQNLLNVNLIQNQLIASSNTGTISSANLAAAVAGLNSADLPYTTVGNDITVKGNAGFQTQALPLPSPPPSTLVPIVFNLGGNLTTHDASQIWGGPINLVSNGTLISGSGAITLTSSVSGAFNFGLNTTMAGGFTQGGTSPFSVAGLELLGSGTAYTIRNAANQINTLAGSTGSVNLLDATALTVGNVGTSTGLNASGAVLLQTAGVNSDITLNQAINANAAGDAVVLASARNFINNAGANAIQANNGRWLVYSNNPASDTFGNLNSNNTALWNASFAGNPPASVTQAGNRYLFQQPQTVTLRPGNDSRLYGDAPNVLNSIATGLSPGVANAFAADTLNTATDGTITLSSPGGGDTITAHVGDYAVIITGLPNGLNGYSVQADNSTPGTLRILRRPVTVAVNNQSREYGDANPVSGSVGAPSSGSFVFGDSISAVTLASNATPSTQAGAAGQFLHATAQTFTAGGGSGSASLPSDYSFTVNDGTLTITQAPLAVQADNKNRVYGDANPLLTASLSGFKNGETLANSGVTGTADLTTSAIATSPVGGYVINAAQGSLAAVNYAFVAFNPGTLTINRRDITLTAGHNAPGTRAYGDSTNPVVGYDVGGQGMANNEDAQTLLGFSVASSADSATPAGIYGPGSLYAYKINGTSVGVQGNYNVTALNDGTLTIDPKTIALLLSASPVSKTYDSTVAIVGAAPTVSANTALAPGDSLQQSSFSFAYDNPNVGLGNKTVFAPIPASNVILKGGVDVTGNYILTGNGSGIYTGDVVNTASSIVPRDISLTAGSNAPGTRFVGDATNPVVGYGVGGQGMVGGENAQSLLGFGIGSSADSATAAGVYGPGNVYAYKINGTSVGVHGNYNLTALNDGTLTIDPRGNIPGPVTPPSPGNTPGPDNAAGTVPVLLPTVGTGDFLAFAVINSSLSLNAAGEIEPKFGDRYNYNTSGKHPLLKRILSALTQQSNRLSILRHGLNSGKVERDDSVESMEITAPLRPGR